MCDFRLIPLEWDSQYYGIPAAKLIIEKQTSIESWDLITESIQQYRFITIQNKSDNAEFSRLISEELGAFLVDVNIQFTKSVINEAFKVRQENIEIVSNYEGNEDILRIARDAFTYSRFYNDKNLEITKSKNIYMNWIKNSFYKFEKYFVLFEENDKKVGFILFSHLDKHTVVIELIAVDNDIETKGIGTRMINSLQRYMQDNEIANIKVGTQIENIKAINFYIGNNFKVIEQTPIYHYWNKVNK